MELMAGFEPARGVTLRFTKPVQSTTMRHQLIKLVGEVGIEPTTKGL